MKAIGLTILLAACAAPQPAASPSTSAAARCVPLAQVVGRRAASGNAVEFEMVDGTVFRNELQGRCPGLERLGSTATVSVASGGDGGLLCSGDRIRVADPIEARATGMSAQPTCLLGEFRRFDAH